MGMNTESITYNKSAVKKHVLYHSHSDKS